MRIGVVSDTHNNLKNVAKIVEIFNAARVDRVIHTGDITQAKTIHAFANLTAPLWGVFGNNDQERERLLPAIAERGFQFSEPPLELFWHGRRIVVVHDPRDLDGVLRDEHDLALHGHTHHHRLERSGPRLIFNPGECAGHMEGYNAVGLVDLDSLDAHLLRF
ncbi:MAG TPA: YfcE family phosphodiesterase [Pseudomonadales bacterium]|nr:YfcE family phosphodiesterase [Pseudomonadales bacterium]